MTVLDTNAASALVHRTPEALSRLRMSEPENVVLCGPVAAGIYHLRRLEGLAIDDWSEAGPRS